MKRCGARLMLGTPLRTMERANGRWRINGEIEAQVIIGAGGHFCPVAKQLSGSTRQTEPAVVAQEVEFAMSSEQRDSCTIRKEVPELYFCADMKGYGWCFRKGDFLNVGLGRQDRHELSRHVSDFVAFLRSTGKIGFDLPSPMQGHAYLLHGESQRKVAGDGFLLIGDAAGLAYAQSGEGIRPAIESGLLAADILIAANGDYTGDRLEGYQDALAKRFGDVQKDWCSRIAGYLPAQSVQSLARMLLETRWFSRRVVLDRWFLHSQLPALTA
jgi:flavin-dependent dehydrogenase